MTHLKKGRLLAEEQTWSFSVLGAAHVGLAESGAPCLLDMCVWTPERTAWGWVGLFPVLSDERAQELGSGPGFR